MSNSEVQKKSGSGSGNWFWGIMITLVVIAIVFFGASIFYFSKIVSKSSSKYYERSGKGSEKVAVVDLNFTIISSEPIVKQFKDFGEDESIKAIILRVNTPGGGVAASQEMYEAIRKVRDAGKPVVVSISSLGASGGYYAACGGSIIAADPGSLVGSIGVIISLTNFKDLAEKLGVSETVIKSGELKDAGNPLRELNEKDREYFQSIVDDSYDQFLDVVSRERKMDKEKLKEYANGRVFTGRQAKEIGLIDSLGTFDDAIMMAARMAGIEGEPAIVRKKERITFFEMLIESISKNELKEVKDELKGEFLDQPVLQYKFIY
jgi:protease-4